MVLKTLNKNYKQSGFTFLEITMVMAILMIFISMVLVTLRPEEKRKLARDNKRLADLQLLDRMINEYLTDVGSYPDLADTLRDSTTLPVGGTSLSSSTTGWINANLSTYNSKLPLDPINDENYKYYYYHNENSYEISSLFESLFDKTASDGGNDNNSYEIGNNLELISP